LFEAAACGTPIISDDWPGLETILEPETEILIADSAEDTLGFLREISPERRSMIGERARKRILAEHTAAHRGVELESYIIDLRCRRAPGFSKSELLYENLK